MDNRLSQLDLIAEHVDSMISEAGSLMESLNRLEAFIFSSSSRIKPDPKISKIKEIYVRKTLFDISAPVDRTAVVANLLPKLKPLQEFVEKTRSEIPEYIDIFKHDDWLSQNKHEKKIIAYSYNAIDELKKIQASVDSIISLISMLGKDPVPKPLKDISHRLKRDFGNIKTCFEDFISYISYFLGAYRIEYYVNMSPGELADLNLFSSKRWSEMKSGDIFVSFKTKTYLKDETISRRIARFTGSQVTHVALFVKIPKGSGDYSSEEYLVHSIGKDYYGLAPLGVGAGEVYIVLRPNMNDEQRLRLWQVVRSAVKEKIRYSKKKLFGVGITMILEWILNLFSRKRRSMHNVFSEAKDGMFCSEFLNEMFRQAGVQLTPKSKHSAMVFPSDIAASPNVKFIGVAFDPKFVEEGKFELKEAVAGVQV